MVFDYSILVGTWEGKLFPHLPSETQVNWNLDLNCSGSINSRSAHTCLSSARSERAGNGHDVYINPVSPLLRVKMNPRE